MTNESISVLYVDDYPPLHDLVKQKLENQDDRFTLHSAVSSEAGIEFLRNRSVDCIVCEYDLPDKGGLDFLNSVRAEHHSLPFIFYTRQDPSDIATKVFDAGADDYLKKQLDPVQYDLLAKKITTLAEKHRAVRRLTHLEQQQHVADGGVYAKAKEEFEQAEESMSVAVIRAVADREQIDPVSLPPLKDAIDPDAIDALFPSTTDENPRAESVTFTYYGYSVTISEDGQITLNE